MRDLISCMQLTQTGVATAVGAMTPVTGQTWTGMSADAATQTMYAASSDCVTSTLYTVDLATGAVTLVGSDASGYCVIDIAISPDGVLFGLDIITDQLVTIDLATGAISPLGSLGLMRIMRREWILMIQLVYFISQHTMGYWFAGVAHGGHGDRRIDVDWYACS